MVNIRILKNETGNLLHDAAIMTITEILLIMEDVIICEVFLLEIIKRVVKCFSIFLLTAVACKLFSVKIEQPFYILLCNALILFMSYYAI